MEEGFNEQCDCKQSVFAYVFEKFKLEYSVVATGRLLFRYDRSVSDKLIGNRIRPYPIKPVPWFEALGLKEKCLNINEDDVLVDEYLKQDIPCVMIGDLFDCDWNEAYQKYHFKHYWIISGKKGDNYIITDPYFGMDEIHKKKDELLKMSSSVYVYDVMKKYENADGRIRKSILEDAIYYLDSKMDRNLKDFKEDLINADLASEKTCSDLYAIPLLDNIKIVGKQRGAYAHLIDRMANHLDFNCKIMADELRESALCWEKLRISLTKSIIRRRNCDEIFVNDILNKIVEIEVNVMNEIKNSGGA